MSPTNLELIECIKAGQDERVRELLTAEPGLAARDATGVSAIMTALYHRRGAIAELLASHSPALDAFESAALGRVDRLREILDGDASAATARSADDGTALHFAAFFGQPDTTALLLERGAELEAVAASFGNVRPLHAAVASRNHEVIRLVLEAGADANAQQQKGWTALHSAGAHGDMQLLEMLLAHGADPRIRGDEGKNALAHAREAGHAEVVRRLEAVMPSSA